MALPPLAATPAHDSYDVVIVGGAMLGAAVAWFLSDSASFQGRVLVVEKDPSYAFTSTARTNSCMRQQFSEPINVRISQFAADFVKNFRAYLGGDARVPDVPLQSFGYMYLADRPGFAEILRQNQVMQAALGAGTRVLSPDEIAAEYPFYALDDIVLGSHNPVDEGYFDGNTLFDWWRRSARERGVEYVTGTVTGLDHDGRQVQGVHLASGARVACGHLVNAAGPRAAEVAAMAGIALPVEPRKRYSFLFTAAEPLSRDLPLTIDPSGVHVRSDGAQYLAGCPPEADPPVAPDDFEIDHGLWEAKAWPAVAARIPAFEAVRLTNTWVGHYAYNTLDQNAVTGPHPEIGNFLFVNGFSGHGFQQAPAMGRGMAEWISTGGYRTLDLSPFHYDRILAGEPFVERAVI